MNAKRVSTVGDLGVAVHLKKVTPGARASYHSQERIPSHEYCISVQRVSLQIFGTEAIAPSVPE